MTCGHTSARLGRRTPNTNILRRLAALALLALCSTHAGLAAAQNQAPEAATGRSAKQGLSFRHQGVAAAQGNFTVFNLHLTSKVIVICIKYQIAGTCFGD